MGLAHPRSRGENGYHPDDMYAAYGSSPLTRGKLVRSISSEPHRRLIPAHAGKTRLCRWWRLRRPAHPRSRGENDQVGVHCLSPSGSSPLTRGKHCREFFHGLHLRLIPAHAGKTCCKPASVDQGVGSSPLTRGKLAALTPIVTAVGLIPAHAGKTRRLRHRSLPFTAHPRSRGENWVGCLCVSVCVGSSPLTRGKLRGWQWYRDPRRLIPAHAGKTRPCPHQA